MLTLSCWGLCPVVFMVPSRQLPLIVETAFFLGLGAYSPYLISLLLALGYGVCVEGGAVGGSSSQLLI